jgi:site-specific DNA-cytosine methylase
MRSGRASLELPPGHVPTPAWEPWWLSATGLPPVTRGPEVPAAPQHRLEAPPRPRPKQASSFTGAGLWALAWLIQGSELVDVAEMDEAACETLRANGIFDAQPTDVWAWSLPPGLDIWSGGPPCQPWSKGNIHRGPEDPRNAYPRILELLLQHPPELRPKVVILENSAEIVRTARLRDYFLESVVPGFEAAGYEVVFWDLSSADYGDPQMRKRAFLVAWPKGAAWGQALRSAPTPTHGRPGSQAVLDGAVLPWVRGFDRLRSGCCGGYAQVDCVNLGNLGRSCETCFSVMGALPANYAQATSSDRRDLTPGEVDYMMRPKSKKRREPRFTAHRPTDFGGAGAFTPLELKDRRVVEYLAQVPVANLSRGVPYGLVTTRPDLREVDVDLDDAEQLRAYLESMQRISVRMAAKIMSVPQWYVFEGTQSQQYKQVGNGIPLGLGCATASHVLAALGFEPGPGALISQRDMGLWPLDRLDPCADFPGITNYPGELPTGAPLENPDLETRPLPTPEAFARAREAAYFSDEALESWEPGIDGDYRWEVVLATWQPGDPQEEPPGFPDWDYFLQFVSGEGDEVLRVLVEHYELHAGGVDPGLRRLVE